MYPGPCRRQPPWFQVAPDARSAVPSQRSLTRSDGCHGIDVHFPQSPTVARSPRVAVAAAEGNVSSVPSNKPINPTHLAASRRLLAQASPRGSRAGYRQRYADTGTVNDQRPCLELLGIGAPSVRCFRTRTTDLGFGQQVPRSAVFVPASYPNPPHARGPEPSTPTAYPSRVYAVRSGIDLSGWRRSLGSPGMAVRAGEANSVKRRPHNKPINPPHFAASRRLLAQAARRGSRAGYRQR